jgi:hypothetical protein
VPLNITQNFIFLIIFREKSRGKNPELRQIDCRLGCYSIVISVSLSISHTVYSRDMKGDILTQAAVAQEIS